jgi:hemerythrin
MGVAILYQHEAMIAKHLHLSLTAIHRFPQEKPELLLPQEFVTSRAFQFSFEEVLLEQCGYFLVKHSNKHTQDFQKTVFGV